MKCAKVKNPCKICFQSVHKRSGLQCQGACQKWAHYKCLNYTPGKIQDIKDGYIKVTCPCPDCVTSEPKEILTDPPFTCTNTKCPANNVPKCTSVECPSNSSLIPPQQPPPFDCISPTSPKRVSSSGAKKCPMKKTSSSNVNSKCKSQQQQQPKYMPKTTKTASSPCPKLQKKSMTCPQSCPSQHLLSPGTNKNPCSPKQSMSCANISDSSNTSGRETLRAISSDSQVPNTCVDKSLYTAIEDLCKTVGQLSNQIQQLMCKMNQS